jgi:hypothetical protein
MSKQNRRKFIAVATALGAGSMANAIPFAKKENKKMLAHHAFFWLKNPDSSEDRETLIEGLRTLSQIETVKKLHIGQVADTQKREVVDSSWQVSELIFFDDLEGQSTYQSHPVHLKFVEKYSHLWEKVIVYDAIEV